SMLALDGDAEQPSKAGEEVRVCDVELPGFGTVNLEDAEWQMPFAASRDQDVDCAPDPVIRQELRRSKPRFFLKMVGDDHLSGLESVARRRFQVETQRRPTDGARFPADAGADQQAIIVGQIFQYLGEPSVETLGAEFGRTLQDLPDVADLQRGAAKLAQQRLLPQAVGKLLPGDIGRNGRRRCRLLPRSVAHALFRRIEVAVAFVET